MKQKKLFCAISAAVAIAALFSGCSNLFDKDDDDSSSSQKGRLLFSASSSARTANTINPTAFNFTSDSGLTFTLTGSIFGGANKTLGTWNDSDSKKAYSLMEADTSVLVDTGNWSFRLSVTKDGKEVLYGTRSLAVKSGDNTLSFGTLSEASEEDSTRTVSVAQGSVNVTISFPADAGIKGATASLTLLDSDETGAENSLAITASSAASSATYTQEGIDAGTYILAIKLYSDSETKDDTTYLNTYTALVNVAPGCESKGSAELTDINTLYTITYELNGGTFEGTVQASYNKYAKITLPTPEKQGYEFSGWAASENGAKAYDDGGSITISENTTLYALWTPVNYTISYNLNDEKAAISNDVVTEFTVETETFTLPTPTTKKGGMAFAGWYTTSSLDNATNLTQIEKGTTKDVILYAKWINTITEQIEAMTESGTIKASGEFSADLITEINKALKNLASNDGTSSVLVTIDLSDVTGLTELEAASSDSQNCSFYSCTNLQRIVLPNTLASIGKSAFSGCTALTSITIPDNVTSIGKSAFSGCTALTSITIPDSVTSIGESAFSGCTSLANVTIGSSVGKIDYYAFSGCKALSSITIPDGVTSIEGDAFYGCTALTSITIPDSVTSIGNYAFYGCESLSSIKIPAAVTLIGRATFYDCTALTSITIPDSVTSIGESAFYRCTALTSITIPDNVTNIGNYAFSGCTSLANVTIGSSVEKIGFYAFRNCSELSNAKFNDTTNWYYTQRNTYSNGTAITPKDLSDSSTAANYLKSNYYEYYWYKE